MLHPVRFTYFKDDASLTVRERRHWHLGWNDGLLHSDLPRGCLRSRSCRLLSKWCYRPSAVNLNLIWSRQRFEQHVSTRQ